MAGSNDETPSASELRAYAYRLLGRREYAVAELAQRLRQKWPEAESVAVDALLMALVDENLLSDGRFVESFVRSHVQRYQGPLKIRAALRARGVDDALVSRELEAHAGQWTELAAAWLERQQPLELDYAARGKYYRRLVNRGFTHDQAMEALDRMSNRD